MNVFEGHIFQLEVMRGKLIFDLEYASINMKKTTIVKVARDDN